MNTKRAIWSGLVTGLIIVLLDGVVNGVILASTFDDAYQTLGLTPDPVAVPVFWFVGGLLIGLAFTWLYALAVPRLGPGARAGTFIMLVVYVLVHLPIWSHAVDRVFPLGLLVVASGLELINWLVAAWLGVRLYRETPRADERDADDAHVGSRVAVERSSN